MIHYDYYADVPEDAVAAFVREARLARLVTIGDGVPHLGLFPFTLEGGGVQVHLHRDDEQIADLRARPRCLFEIDEPLAAIPSHWIDEENASFATAYHRTVAYECTAKLVDDPAAIAEQQNWLMDRYQPEGRRRAVAADDPMFRGMLRLLVGVRLTIDAIKVKWKLGQNRRLDDRRSIAERLRERGGEFDRKSADLLEWTVDLGWTIKGRAR